MEIQLIRIGSHWEAFSRIPVTTDATGEPGTILIRESGATKARARKAAEDKIAMLRADACNRGWTERRAVRQATPTADSKPLYQASRLVGEIVDGKLVSHVGGFGRDGERIDFTDGTARWLTWAEIDQFSPPTCDNRMPEAA